MSESNVQKMREALKEIRARLVYLYGRLDGTFSPPALKEVYEIADDALSTPPRNCDVGTANGQIRRFHSFCRKKGGCSGCSFIKFPTSTTCFAHWAQMPYGSEERQ